MQLKDIPGYNTRYAITQNGLLWSYPKRGHVSKGMWMKPHIKNGYLHVQLRINGTHRYEAIHRLVAITYILNPENKRTINHKDSNKLNNYIGNLEWATDKENIQHCYNNNMRPNAGSIAKNNLRSKNKLTEQDKIDIRKIYAEMKCAYRLLSDKYGVSRNVIRDIIKKRRSKKERKYIPSLPCLICKKLYKPLRRKMCYGCYEKHRVGGRNFQHEYFDNCCIRKDSSE